MSNLQYEEIIDPDKIEIFPNSGWGFINTSAGLRVMFNDNSHTSALAKTVVQDVKNAKDDASLKGKFMRIGYSLNYTQSFVTDLHIFSMTEDKPSAPQQSPSP